MHRQGLRSLLRPGTPTWEHLSLDRMSTIDLVLGTEGVQQRLTFCRIHEVDHGSDHKSIETRLDLQTESQTPKQGKRLYRDADWDRIRQLLSGTLVHEHRRDQPLDKATLDRQAA